MSLIFPKDLQSYGAGGRTRTDMSVTSPDFESGAYTNFATPAARAKDNSSSWSRIATAYITGY
jgi:hypothetical protein